MPPPSVPRSFIAPVAYKNACRYPSVIVDEPATVPEALIAIAELSSPCRKRSAPFVHNVAREPCRVFVVPAICPTELMPEAALETAPGAVSRLIDPLLTNAFAVPDARSAEPTTTPD